MRPTAQLRQLLRDEQPVVAPGVYDAVSAKLAERIGFHAAYLTGYGTVASAYGLPDLGLATMTEMVDHAARVAQSVSIPVLADADTGHGNALNVKRTVRAFERSGVAGIHLEDQVAPKKCGHMAGKQVIPVDEMCGKLRAALDARQDPELIIIARTDAVAPEGFDAAITRARAYLEVGADLAFVEAPETEEQLRKVPELIDGPCMFNAVLSERGALVPVSQLKDYGYRLVIFPTATLWAAAGAVARTLVQIQQSGDLSLDCLAMSFEEFNELIGAPALQAEANRYG